MNTQIPFLWDFIEDSPILDKATGGEEGEKTASVNEENTSAIIEFLHR